MAKSKDKKKKKNAESDYPEKINPFGSTEKPGKNGKKKHKEKETNPFLMKPTKSMKKREKAERKEMKKEQKREKKENKKNAKAKKSESNEVPSTNITVTTDDVPDSSACNGKNVTDNSTIAASRQIGTIGSYDPPIRHSETEPLFSRDAKVSRTLDGRSPTRQEKPSPILSNKRILELKTGRDICTNQNSSLPDLTQKTHYQYRPKHANSEHNMADIGATKPRDASSLPPSKQRPESLELPSASQSNKLSPVKENRSPSPLVPRPHPEDSDVKMYRTSSISKKGKDKKKKKKLKRLLKKKKKKNVNTLDVIEEQRATDQVVMRRPRTHDVETLRRQVEEVAESARNSVIQLVEQRNSALDRLTENTAQLEEFAHGFATVAHEARLKQQARTTCCGIGSKWKVCWYICACEGKIKRRKRKEQKNGKGVPEAVELLDDDDYYRPANVEDARIPTEREAVAAEVETNPFLSKSSTLPPKSPGDGSTEQAQQSNTLKSKLIKVPKKIRGSLPSLVDDNPPSGRSLRSMANIDPRERKSSSVSALHEIVKKRGAKEREERYKREKLEEEGRNKLPPMSRPLSYLANIDPRQRKSSSVSALNEIKKSRAEKRREEKEKRERQQQREKREKDINNFASQYDDEDTRKKVTELLRLDLS